MSPNNHRALSPFQPSLTQFSSRVQHEDFKKVCWQRTLFKVKLAFPVLHSRESIKQLTHYEMLCDPTKCYTLQSNCINLIVSSSSERLTLFFNAMVALIIITIRWIVKLRYCAVHFYCEIHRFKSVFLRDMVAYLL